MELISIIIPVYNAMNYLNRCIDSIIKQSYKEIEIILVNDGSTDDSLKICKDYSNIDNRIKVIDKNNEGVSAARNDGIEIANGKYITFIDADDYISFDYIEILYSNIKTNNGDSCFVNAINFDENGKEKIYQRINKIEELSKIQLLKELLKEEKIIGTCWGVLYRTDLIKKIKFDEKMKIGEDFKFLVNYIEKTNNNILIPGNKYYYFERAGSAIHSGFSSNWYDEIIYCESLIKKYLSTELEIYAIKRYIRVNIDCICLFKLTSDEKRQLKLNISRYKRKYLISKNIKLKQKIKFILSFFI